MLEIANILKISKSGVENNFQLGYTSHIDSFHISSVWKKIRFYFNIIHSLNITICSISLNKLLLTMNSRYFTTTWNARYCGISKMNHHRPYTKTDHHPKIFILALKENSLLESPEELHTWLNAAIDEQYPELREKVQRFHQDKMLYQKCPGKDCYNLAESFFFWSWQNCLNEKILNFFGDCKKHWEQFFVQKYKIS